MAIGTNTLGLLFKIGVDAGDAKKILDNMKTAAVEGFGEGIKKGAKQAEDGLEKLGTKLNQTRAGLENAFRGDALEGVLGLTRALGPLGLALGGIAIAAGAVAVAIKGAVDAAADIGTTSKEDFEKLQKSVENAGQHITEFQRAMAGGILDALDRISGATTALFAKIIEKDGKALIALFNEIANFITQTLIPVADKFGDRLADGIARLIALWRVLNKEFTLGDWLKGLPTLEDDFAKSLGEVRAEIAAINPVAKKLVDTHKEHHKVVKDLTEAQLELNQASRAAARARDEQAVAEKEINDEQKRGAITFEEGANRRLAVLREVIKAEEAVLDARERQVRGDPALLARKRQDELEKIEAERASLRLREAQAREDEARKIVEQDKKLHDALTEHFAKERQQRLDYVDFLRKQTDIIVAELARQAQPPPIPIPRQVPGVAEGQLPKPPTGFFRDFADTLSQSQDQFETWGKALANVFALVAGAMQEMLAGFILTGKLGGAAFKRLAADIIASIAVQSLVKAVFEVAEGFAALAQVPPNIPSATAHFTAAKIYGTVGAIALAAGGIIGAAGGLGGGGGAAAAAGGGGFGGGSTEPSPVNISLGGRNTALGITLATNQQLANAVIDLNNKITSMSPGDVLARGADQNPEAFAQGTLEAGRRNGAFTREFMQISGARA